jgi:hypothetical protein
MTLKHVNIILIKIFRFDQIDSRFLQYVQNYSTKDSDEGIGSHPRWKLWTLSTVLCYQLTKFCSRLCLPSYSGKTCRLKQM